MHARAREEQRVSSPGQQTKHDFMLSCFRANAGHEEPRATREQNQLRGTRHSVLPNPNVIKADRHPGRSSILIVSGLSGSRIPHNGPALTLSTWKHNRCAVTVTALFREVIRLGACDG